jgi:hypothetical protein
LAVRERVHVRLKRILAPWEVIRGGAEGKQLQFAPGEMAQFGHFAFVPNVVQYSRREGSTAGVQSTFFLAYFAFIVANSRQIEGLRGLNKLSAFS